MTLVNDTIAVLDGNDRISNNFIIDSVTGKQFQYISEGYDVHVHVYGVDYLLISSYEQALLNY